MPFHHDYQFSKKVTGVGEEGRGGLWLGFHFQGLTFLEMQLCTRKPAWPGSRGPKLSPDMASCLCVLWGSPVPQEGQCPGPRLSEVRVEGTEPLQLPQ